MLIYMYASTPRDSRMLASFMDVWLKQKRKAVSKLGSRSLVRGLRIEIRFTKIYLYIYIYKCIYT